ncbi:MAG: hypothetical protein NTX50_12340 [Candidatus Sumerlaeota bacterium]|nr:hypothetical protein [Candidatus Sumerlaeota bacterium]
MENNSEPRQLEICSVCKSLITAEYAGVCDMCKKPTPLEKISEQDFMPVILLFRIHKNLSVDENTLCDMFFMNLDCADLTDVHFEISSRAFEEESYQVDIPRVGRGMLGAADGDVEVCFVRAGETKLNFHLELTDSRGARRKFSGSQRIKITKPSTQSMTANVTFDLKDAEVYGADFSEMMKMQQASPSSAAACEEEDFSRIPIALKQMEFIPPARQQPCHGILGGKEPCVCDDDQKARQPLAKPFPHDLRRARFVFEGAEHGRKVMILSPKPILIGRANWEQSEDMDLPLRRLPCRDKERDPENYKLTKTISARHAWIEIRDGRYCVKDISSHGLSLAVIEGAELPKAESSAGAGKTSFHTPFDEDDSQFSLPSAAEAQAERRSPSRRLSKGEWTPLPDLCELVFAHHAMVLRAQTFYRSKGGLSALGLRRLGNHPELEYVLIHKRIYIGSGHKCPIRVNAPGFPPIAAALDWRDGYYAFIAGVDQPAVRLDGAPVPKGKSIPLQRPCLIEIGDYKWRFEEACIKDFTDVG